MEVLGLWWIIVELRVFNFIYKSGGCMVNYISDVIEECNQCSSFVGIKDGNALFKVIGRKNKFYMKAYIIGMQKYHIVEVHARDLIDFWKGNSYSGQEHLPYMSISRWKKDRKFRQAYRYCTLGSKSPFPLGTFYIGKSGTGGYAGGFSDGVTRSLVLLADGVEFFPILCGDAFTYNVLQCRKLFCSR